MVLSRASNFETRLCPLRCIDEESIISGQTTTSLVTKMTGDMYQLRRKLSTSCPIIYTGNWELEHNKGWRWECNVNYVDLKEAHALLDEYLDAHGRKNVTVGHPFDEDLLKPSVLEGYCGLYIRDVQDLVTTLTHDLDDLDAVERWLHE